MFHPPIAPVGLEGAAGAPDAALGLAGTAHFGPPASPTQVAAFESAMKDAAAAPVGAPRADDGAGLSRLDEIGLRLSRQDKEQQRAADTMFNTEAGDPMMVINAVSCMVQASKASVNLEIFTSFSKKVNENINTLLRN